MDTSLNQTNNEPPVYRVPKVCKECSKPYTGNSWRPQKNEDHVQVGICDSCAAAAQAEIEKFKLPGKTGRRRRGKVGRGQEVELETPITADDYDGRYR